MSKEENVIVQGTKKFNKELADAVEVTTHYCSDCQAWHIGKETMQWDPNELKMPIPELKKLSDEGKAKAPKEEVENVFKFYQALKVRKMI